MLPVSVRLFLDPYKNYDFYWQRQIETPVMQGTYDKRLRYDKRTSELMKIIGKGLHISPTMLQHEVELVGAGLARNLLWLADVAMGKKKAKGTGLEDGFITRRFFGKINEWNNDVAEELRAINDVLSDMNKAKGKGLSRLPREQAETIYKSNRKYTDKLYLRRDELMEMKKAIQEMLNEREQ